MYFKLCCLKEQFVTREAIVLLSFGRIVHKLCCIIHIHLLLKSWGAASLLISTVIYQFPKITSVT